MHQLINYDTSPNTGGSSPQQQRFRTSGSDGDGDNTHQTHWNISSSSNGGLRRPPAAKTAGHPESTTAATRAAEPLAATLITLGHGIINLRPALPAKPVPDEVQYSESSSSGARQKKHSDVWFAAGEAALQVRKCIAQEAADRR